MQINMVNTICCECWSRSPGGMGMGSPHSVPAAEDTGTMVPLLALR